MGSTQVKEGKDRDCVVFVVIRQTLHKMISCQSYLGTSDVHMNKKCTELKLFTVRVLEGNRAVTCKEVIIDIK